MDIDRAAVARRRNRIRSAARGKIETSRTGPKRGGDQESTVVTSEAGERTFNARLLHDVEGFRPFTTEIAGPSPPQNLALYGGRSGD